MKKVSIIMPNYNHAPYLKERMNSILAQDYPDYEVILLDDASTDDSAAVLSRYMTRKEVTHRVINKTNSGNTFVQWEKGLQRAKGEYVWIAESDDVADPGFLSRMVAVLERENAVLAFCRSQWIDSAGQPLKRTQDARWNRDFSMDGVAFAKRFLMGYTTICNASAVVFRRDAAEKIPMQKVAQFTASGDRLFWIMMAMRGRVAYVADRLNKFRQHTCKVSGSAEYAGLNIVQDYEIYRMMAPKLELSRYQRRWICGYHWQAMHRPTVSEEGRQRAMKAWGQEPLFGRWAYVVYMIHRAKEKC